MTPSYRRYVAIEMAISAVINAVLSIAFVFVLFAGQALVPVAGMHGLVVDAVPQSLMVALMSSLVPTLLTRRRVANGAIGGAARAHRWPRHAFVRALAIAVPVALAAGLIQAAVLPLFGVSFAFADVVAAKAIYGAMLGAGVASVAVRVALADVPTPRDAR